MSAENMIWLRAKRDSWGQKPIDVSLERWIGFTEETTATRCGSRPGGRRNRKALTILNIVAFTAMPSARVSTATSVIPAFSEHPDAAASPRKGFHEDTSPA